jgi:hypothetical protein
MKRRHEDSDDLSHVESLRALKRRKRDRRSVDTDPFRSDDFNETSVNKFMEQIILKQTQPHTIQRPHQSTKNALSVKFAQVQKLDLSNTFLATQQLYAWLNAHNENGRRQMVDVAAFIAIILAQKTFALQMQHHDDMEHLLQEVLFSFKMNVNIVDTSHVFAYFRPLCLT